MSGFSRIHISLCLMLLRLTAGSAQYSSLCVREGDELTLPCEYRIQDQDGCGSTTWLFSDFTAQVELVRGGQVVKEAKSDRVRVSANCSLLLQQVTDEDVGLYTCRSLGSTHPDTFFQVYVIKMTEQRDGDEVTLSCSLSNLGHCDHTLRWLLRGQTVDGQNRVMKTSRAKCSATVTFPTAYFEQQSQYHALFMCEVTVTYTGSVQQFAFSPPSSGETPGENATTTTTSTQKDCSALSVVMLVLRVAELLLLTVITVLLFRAAGNQRPPDDNMVKEGKDEDDDTVKYENCGDAPASVRLR